MADISKIKKKSTQAEYNIKDATARSSISTIEGLIPSSATTSNKLATAADIPSITGKADKVSGATSGNFAGLDSNGNLTDSGKKASDFMASDGVTANPTGTATGDLTSIGIGGTKYNIPSGGGGTDENAYHTGDTAETTLADDDYFPFYDTSATAKRKTSWSNIKGKIKDYLFGFFSAGLINDNGYIKNQISGFSVEDSGTASANSVKEQIINYTENSVGSSVIHMVSINGTKYFEQNINAQANTDTTFTFSSSELTYASVLDIFAGCKTADYAIPTLKSKTLSVSGSTGTLTLVYNVPIAYALTVRVYIRG